MDAPRVRAPELTGAVAWLNVARPLSLAALRGKVVLLDFWTYGCINCIHVLPDLKQLEARYERELVVIGVHSAKFTNERDTDNLRRILLRYEIEHPVANDAEFTIWRAYGVRAWPTQVLIDPSGFIVSTASGEGHGDAFDRAISAIIMVFDERGELDRSPLPLALERARLPGGGPLAFPGKVLADAARDRLYIADSSHHRIVSSTLSGAHVATVGTGLAGSFDGSLAEATFNRPQGLALDETTLYVADTENHLIRAVDLEARRVTTSAGTRERATWSSEGGAALRRALNSPWDLARKDRLLFIAMAGPHQIWLLDLDRGLVWPYGSGREARLDGSLDESAFAQPSGLALTDTTLFVADSESNIIRAIDLPPVNQVRTLAGGDLFEFGDTDGRGDAVRLQHPLGIAHHEGALYSADTYNHRIKRLDPATGSVRTFAGAGVAGPRTAPQARHDFTNRAG